MAAGAESLVGVAGVGDGNPAPIPIISRRGQVGRSPGVSGVPAREDSERAVCTFRGLCVVFATVLADCVHRFAGIG